MSDKISPQEEIRQSLQRMSPQFKAALPSHIQPEKFIRVAQTAIQMNPDLLSADRHSLYAASMRCAQEGLLPDGREAAFVVFKSKDGPRVVFMPMLQGILKKVRNSGELSSINAQVVYTHDDFDYWIDEEGEHLTHRPKFDGERGAIRLTYAIARTKDGAVYVEVMTEQQIQAVKNSSRSKDSGPWAGPFEDEMRRKTAIRRLAKRLPMSTDLDETIRADDENYEFTPPQPQQAVIEEPKKKRIEKIVEAKVVETKITALPVDEERAAIQEENRI